MDIRCQAATPGSLAVNLRPNGVDQQVRPSSILTSSYPYVSIGSVSRAGGTYLSNLCDRSVRRDETRPIDVEKTAARSLLVSQRRLQEKITHALLRSHLKQRNIVSCSCSLSAASALEPHGRRARVCAHRPLSIAVSPAPSFRKFSRHQRPSLSGRCPGRSRGAAQTRAGGRGRRCREVSWPCSSVQCASDGGALAVQMRLGSRVGCVNGGVPAAG